ncbi:MAG: AAA family ATPase [Mogibacterium sp.]|nr:AAA family ATPase [Mogibacterium sp.]
MSNINISDSFLKILENNQSSDEPKRPSFFDTPSEPEIKSPFDTLKTNDNYPPDPNASRKIRSEFLASESGYDKYGRILDSFVWEDEEAADMLAKIPERFFVMVDEMSEKCRFRVEFEEDDKKYFVRISAPDVVCGGESLVDTRNELRKKSVENSGLVKTIVVDPDNPRSTGLAGSMCPGRRDPDEKGKNCQYYICPVDVAVYVSYLKAYGLTDSLRMSRVKYMENKDKVDLDTNNPWYFLNVPADLIFNPFGRGYFIPEDKMIKARKMLDEGLFSSVVTLDEKERPMIMACYDGTYRRMEVTDFGKRNNTEPFADLFLERRPAETKSKRQSALEKNVADAKLSSAHDFRQFSPCPYCDNEFCEIKYASFADMLIQSGNYASYIEKSRKNKQRHDKEYAQFTEEIPRLAEIKDAISVQNSFFGCVTGNSENFVRKIASLIAEEITYRPGVSPNVARMTMMEMMTELRSNTYYKKITDFTTEMWGKPANNQIYILNGVDEFIKFIANPQQKEAGMNLIDHLIHVRDNKYFILTGTKYDLDCLFNEFVGISNVFSLGSVDLKDMTAVEIYDAFTNMLTDNLKAAITEEFRNKAIDYISLNQGVLPYNNMEMAVYLSAYVNQKGLQLPKMHNVDVEKMLSEIIGMDDIKQKLKDFEAYTKYQKMVKGHGAKVPSANTHMVFLGNPGTGKTTIARIVAQMMFNIGLLRKNTVIEVQRKDLIGEYVGHTAIKTQEVIDKAMGGVLFIDEAYALTASGSSNDFGGECVATLIKAMEDHKDDLIVIFAGYVDEMRMFLASNPGLESRVGYVFRFEDYEVDDLVKIFNVKMTSNGYRLEDGVEEKVGELCRYFSGKRDFGNGRFVDKVIQQTLVRHAQNADENNLITIKPEDIPEIEDVQKTSAGGWEMVNPKDITKEELMTIAVHELGHAIAGYYLAGNMEIEKISVQADASGTLGFVKYDLKKKALESEKDLINQLAVTLSGKNAEEVVFQSHTSGCSNDIQKATALAKRMVTDFAMGDWLDENAHVALLRKADQLSKDVLEEHKEKLTGLADELVARGSITKEEIEDFLK